MAPDSRPFAICLMGPTAVGKTALALSLCERLDCEIISVDSAQVYRGMDIGTAKPDADTLSRYPHRLIDIRDPADSYSAAAFRDDALLAMEEILAAGRTPLLVGGTMLYFRALIHGMATMPGADQLVRARIAEFAGREGWEAVHRWLAQVDPVAAERIGPFNHQRMQRALEVFLSSGRPISELHAEAPMLPALPCRLLQIALLPADRAVLHRRIASRFQAMLNAGFLDEVRRLHQRGDLDPAMPSMRSVGYRQAWERLDGVTTHAEMIERAVAATRQLAKRQLTWLRSWQDLQRFEADEPDIDNIFAAVLKLLGATTI